MRNTMTPAPVLSAIDTLVAHQTPAMRWLGENETRLAPVVDGPAPRSTNPHRAPHPPLCHSRESGNPVALSFPEESAPLDSCFRGNDMEGE